MDVGAAFAADSQSAELVQPRDRAFNDPSQSAQARVVVAAASRQQNSYIDSVILRDDHEQGWDEPADSTLERRVYYVQNWRADVIALLGVNGRVLERVWYEAYGTPHGSPAAEFGSLSMLLEGGGNLRHAPADALDHLA